MIMSTAHWAVKGGLMATMLDSVILRDQAIQAEMQKPWIKGQVDRHLLAMIYWTRNGYPWTKEQKEQLEWLCGAVNGRDDENV